MSTNTDLRLCFPLNLFCMAALTTTLVLALFQSVNPPRQNNSSMNNPSDISGPHDPSATPTRKDQPLPSNPQLTHGHEWNTGQHYWDPGRDEDNYWDDGATTLRVSAKPAWSA
jgi:hypothetical protein